MKVLLINWMIMPNLAQVQTKQITVCGSATKYEPVRTLQNSNATIKIQESRTFLVVSAVQEQDGGQSPFPNSVLPRVSGLWRAQEGTRRARNQLISSMVVGPLAQVGMLSSIHCCFDCFQYVSLHLILQEVSDEKNRHFLTLNFISPACLTFAIIINLFFTFLPPF